MSPRKPRPPKTPKAPKLWDLRPHAEKGAPTMDEVYRAVGMALTSWEYVELALADMFVLFIGAPEESPPRDPAVRAYGSVTSFNSRSDMVDAAGESYFHTDYNKKPSDPRIELFREARRSELRELFKRVRGFADRRNDIAHGIVSADPRGTFLYPAQYNAKKYPLSGERLTVHRRARFCWVADDIHYYRQEFERLYDDLQSFCTHIRNLDAMERRAKREATAKPKP